MPRPPTSPITIPKRPSREPERVVPVAAGVVARVRRHVADDELEPGELGQVAGQQRALQGLGGAVLALEQPRVVEREAGAAAELLGQLELARGVLAARLRPHEGDRPERALAGGERHDHHAVHLQLAHEPHLLLVERRRLQQRAVDHRVELRAAAADDRGRAGRRVRVGRVLLLQLARPADLLRIDVGDRDLAVAARAGPRTSRRGSGPRAARPPRASGSGPASGRAPGWRRPGTRAPPRGGGAR